VLEITTGRGQGLGHEAIETAGRIAPEQAWFIHMSHEIEHGELDGSLPDGMALTYDGLVLR